MMFGGNLARKLRIEQLEDRCLLATITVTSETDAMAELDNDNGTLTLREAIRIVSLDYRPQLPSGGDLTHIDDIATLGQNDTIIIPSGIITTGIITLDSMLGQMNIKRSVTITGPGRNLLAIDAGGTSRIIPAPA